jgi:hypothetical protein
MQTNTLKKNLYKTCNNIITYISFTCIIILHLDVTAWLLASYTNKSYSKSVIHH